MPKILQGGHSYGPSRSGKNIALIKGMTRKRRPKLPGSATRKREQTKTCTVCDVTFENRFAYSNHCRNPSHKAKALERKEQKNDDDKPVSTHVKLAADGTELTDNRGDEQQPGLVTEEQDADEDISDEIDHESGGDVNDGDEEDDFEEEVANEDTDSYDGNLQENSKYKNKYSEQSISVELPDTKPEHVEKLVPIFVCTICDKKYPNRYYMAKHLLSKFHKNRALADPREHFQMLERYHKYVVRLSPFQCAICRFYFNAYDDFKEHINGDEHGNNCSDLVGEMMCTLCSFKTHQNSEMLKHFVTESHMVKIHENKYACILKQNLVGCKCKFCGLEMRSIKRLTRHVVLKHADKKPVEGVTKRQIGVRNRPICSLCTRKFSCQSALNIHMERKHMNAKKHVCKICNVFFADVYSFKRHTEKNLKHLQKVANSKQVAEGSKGEDLLSNSNCQQTPKLEVKTSQVSVNTAKDVKTPENINESNTAWNINVKVAFPKAIREDAADANVIAVRDTHKDVTGMVETVKTRKRRPKKEPVPSPNQAPMKKLKLVKCDYCDFTVTKYNDLRLHYMENHSAKIKVCEHCDLVFLSEKSYRIHCNSEAHQKCLDSNLENSKEQQFKCDVCKKSFPDEKYRNFHTAYHHLHIHTDADLDKIRGERCATYKQYREFLDHIEATVSDPNTKVLCSECGAHVQRKAILSHLRLHTKDRPFKCNLCAKGFATGNCLRRHLQFHFGIAERKCEFCGKEFFRGEHYMKHMLIHKAEQANEALYSCDICKVNFPLEIQLTRHMRRHEERKYKCEHPGCHWKFVFQGELNAHMRTHMEVKKYLCDFCGFAAHTEYHLRRHKKIHTAERKFHCEYCTYKAGNKTHLRRHMRIHIGSKPFKCPYCSYACNTHENIRKHILLTQKHKGKFVYPCKFCNYGTNSCDDFHKHLTENHENDLGPNFRHTSLSVFTGLYQKDQDPNKPVEGMQIIQLKERKNTRRTKQNGEEDSDDTLKDLDSDQAINLSNKDRKPVKQRSPRRSKAAKLEVSQVNHLDAAQYLILLNADAQHYADMNEVEDLSAKDLIIDDTPLDGDSIKIVPTASSYNGGSVVTMLRSQYMPMADVPRTHVAQAAPQTYQVHTSGASISYQNYNMH
ncbi:hypothetical protein DPMN_175895 [Dreissena polymorpha]|uniref:C2H2-type domain-containing protein n=2 Tax=Dreissena polymorpha TaxID=45954 RepID=A0A9D4IK19_DREPO|nr:hypothetical protein DPMN_175895 [Dreissena polymorpha]